MTCVSHRAAYNGDLQTLQTLLEAGILPLDHRDQLGSTLLHKGTAHCDTEAELGWQWHHRRMNQGDWGATASQTRAKPSFFSGKS